MRSSLKTAAAALNEIQVSESGAGIYTGGLESLPGDSDV